MACQHILAAVALTTAAAGCVASDADANVVILRNQALISECVAGGDPEAAFNSSGRINRFSPEGYLFSPIVQNFAQDVEGSSLRIAFVHGARIDIHFADEAREDALAGQDGLTRFQVPLSGSIEPGGTIGLIFEILPAALLPMLADNDLVLIDVRLFGEMGGNSFESAVFRYPVEVCDNCFIRDLGACSGLPIDYMPAGNPCGVLQDATMDCCRDPQNQLVCPAEGTMTP